MLLHLFTCTVGLPVQGARPLSSSTWLAVQPDECTVHTDECTGHPLSSGRGAVPHLREASSTVQGCQSEAPAVRSHCCAVCLHCACSLKAITAQLSFQSHAAWSKAAAAYNRDAAVGVAIDRLQPDLLARCLVHRVFVSVLQSGAPHLHGVPLLHGAPHRHGTLLLHPLLGALLLPKSGRPHQVSSSWAPGSVGPVHVQTRVLRAQQ